MAACRILLLGPPQISAGGKLSRIGLRKAVALIAYLAVEQRAFSREHLAALLWPELGQKRALANLRRMLLDLRRTLPRNCLHADGDQLRLEPGFVPTDVAEFSDRARNGSGRSHMENLEEAARLYRGAFLEGFNLGDCPEFDEWQDAVRFRLESDFDRVLDSLTRLYLDSGYPESALPHALRWLELNPLNEAAHRTLMRIHAAAGRIDLARRQYADCIEILANEGLEPEEETASLHEAIDDHRFVPAAAAGGEAPPLDIPLAAPEIAPPIDAPRAAAVTAAPFPPRRTRHTLHWAIRVASVVVMLGTLTGLLVFHGFFRNPDIRAEEITPASPDGALERLRIGIGNTGGVTRRPVGYRVVFTRTTADGTLRDYVVYSDRIRLGREPVYRIDLDAGDIGRYVETEAVPIPPGDYTAMLIVDHSRSDSGEIDRSTGLVSDGRFFFPGASGVPVFEIEISFEGERGLGEDNPLKIFIGDRSQHRNVNAWGQFTVTREGLHHFPLEDLRIPDTDGSGYFLMLVNDPSDDLSNPFFIDPADIPALYKEGPGNLVYGTFTVSAGTPLEPGRRYRVGFVLPPFPAPDGYEVDDWDALGTPIAFSDLPVRQLHTFHDEGTGDVDHDWYRIVIPEGRTVTIETFSAGGLWECDTAVDIADRDTSYIGSSLDKSFDDNYSRLTYTNETGVEQEFHILVKPFNQHDLGDYWVGEYIVEFREDTAVILPEDSP